MSELAAQIQSTREDEQRRIARELHDDLGQQLRALKMGIAVLETQLAAGNNDLSRSQQQSCCKSRSTPRGVVARHRRQSATADAG
ncbi:MULTISPECIES: histidine kinase [Paraburkholderia]|uniref:Signal transduction histidine kinase subgroup 3 dimerisation and phosphoacceptor domain-containing protein n=1 Tax=Paraburkholderia podalyriae TaxID=1938811 RepID=A0ABR7PY20_9BURK|nr:histidine kinase [Paraburkholderia podalyriae]MBC8751132.1 hypothetical protein [Paraburkholderia podalyriae]